MGVRISNKCPQIRHHLGQLIVDGLSRPYPRPFRRDFIQRLGRIGGTDLVHCGGRIY